VPSADTQAAVAVEVQIDASPETVFDFFTDPDKMIQWMGRTAELDPRPQGDFRVDINGRDIARGQYVQVDPPHRVVFTWGWESEESSVRPGSSTVEVTLTREGQGTRVRLAHHGLPTEDSRAAHGHGWDHYLPRLATVAAGGEAGPDPWATLEERAEGTEQD
jgi:uncharacterized protein YndB with AHSA1/START domain